MLGAARRAIFFSKKITLAYETRNRGPQTGDKANFGPDAQEALWSAAEDYGYLQERGYGKVATTKVVGDRYRLNARQRTALQRIAASETEIKRRKQKEVAPAALFDQHLAIDGFNLLITLESALSGGYVFRCRDGAFRDMASISGSYKRVQQTQRAIELVARALQDLRPASVTWYLDRPVSNSGKLAGLIRQIGQSEGIEWEVILDPDPDSTIINLPRRIAISSDSWVMDESYGWCNLTALILRNVEGVNVVEEKG